MGGAAAMHALQPVLLLTRPRDAAARFLQSLDPSVAFEPVISPLLQITHSGARHEGDPPGALVLSSENGAVAAGRMGFPAGLPAYCVGDRTSEAARQQGFAPQSAAGDAEALVDLLLSSKVPEPLLHLRGEHARGDIVARLVAAGLRAGERVVYRQSVMALTEEARSALAGNRPVVVPLFSPRTAAILVRQGPFAAPLHVIALSQAVADNAGCLAPLSLRITDRPDAAAMAKGVAEALGQLSGAGPLEAGGTGGIG